MGTDLTTTAMKYESGGKNRSYNETEEWLKSESKSDRRGRQNQISQIHMQKQAHMGDQAGSSRDVDAPAAPPRHRGLLSAASPSASNARRLWSLPSCML